NSNVQEMLASNKRKCLGECDGQTLINIFGDLVVERKLCRQYCTNIQVASFKRAKEYCKTVGGPVVIGTITLTKHVKKNLACRDCKGRVRHNISKQIHVKNAVEDPNNLWLGLWSLIVREGRKGEKLVRQIHKNLITNCHLGINHHVIGIEKDK
ncbi:hypothetical protein HPP92_027330, partial [Vanilla planifolia]